MLLAQMYTMWLCIELVGRIACIQFLIAVKNCIQIFNINVELLLFIFEYIIYDAWITYIYTFQRSCTVSEETPNFHPSLETCWVLIIGCLRMHMITLFELCLHFWKREGLWCIFERVSTLFIIEKQEHQISSKRLFQVRLAGIIVYLCYDNLSVQGLLKHQSQWNWIESKSDYNGTTKLYIWGETSDQ